MSRKLLSLLLQLCILFLLDTPAFAQDDPKNNQDESVIIPEDSDAWQFDLAPLYLWFAGIEGNSSIGPVTAPLDVSFNNVMENLETVFTFGFEARKHQWGFFVDYMLLDIAPQTSTPVGTTVNTNVHNNIVEFGGGYMIRDAAPSIELLAGVRYTNLEISVSPGPPVNINENLWDGYGGVRLIQALGTNSGWSLIGKADVGGGSSDLTWSALALVNWQYKKWGSVRAGYKWLAYDYQTGTGPDRFTYDVVYQGPILGMVFSW